MSMSSIIQTLKKNKRFLISTHINPDPDALCSELAMADYLRSLGKSVRIINNQPLSGRFAFLPGMRAITSYKEQQKVPYDAAIIVDCGDLNRIGRVQHLLKKKKRLINIDHHVTNDRFGDLNLVKPKASSTAEVLYELFDHARCKWTKNLAMHLYIGIMTDTGSFRFENTTARTHAIAARLMSFGFSAPRLYRKLYEIISFNDLKEFTKIIGQFDTLVNGKVVSVTLTRETLSKFSGNFDLRDEIFKFLRSIKGVEVFVIFTQVEPKKTRVNLRSTNKFDVAKLANMFNGGGHRRASGCLINQNIRETRKKVLREIRKIL